MPEDAHVPGGLAALQFGGAERPSDGGLDRGGEHVAVLAAELPHWRVLGPGDPRRGRELQHRPDLGVPEQLAECAEQLRLGLAVLAAALLQAVEELGLHRRRHRQRPSWTRQSPRRLPAAPAQATTRHSPKEGNARTRGWARNVAKPSPSLSRWVAWAAHSLAGALFTGRGHDETAHSSRLEERVWAWTRTCLIAVKTSRSSPLDR